MFTPKQKLFPFIQEPVKEKGPLPWQLSLGVKHVNDIVTHGWQPWLVSGH